jgi:hypothetical protein
MGLGVVFLCGSIFFPYGKNRVVHPYGMHNHALMSKKNKVNKDKVYYTYKGKTYEIISDDVPPLQLLNDFKHCESIRDWVTINNRITGGLMWGWLKEVKEFEV